MFASSELIRFRFTTELEKTIYFLTNDGLEG